MLIFSWTLFNSCDLTMFSTGRLVPIEIRKRQSTNINHRRLVLIFRSITRLFSSVHLRSHFFFLDNIVYCNGKESRGKTGDYLPNDLSKSIL